MTESEFKKLVRSIKKTKGKYLKENPIEVRRLKEDIVEIINGEHRYRASKILGYTTIPVKILDVTEEEAIDLCVIFNKNRGNIHYFKISKLLNEKKQRLGLTQKQLGEEMGYSRSQINNLLRIYPNLIKNYDEDWWLATNFSNKIFENLARATHDNLRQKLIDKTIENRNNWKYQKIRAHATKFNDVIRHLNSLTNNEFDVEQILKSITDEILFDFDFPALKNRINEIYKKISEERVIYGDCLKKIPLLDYIFDAIITDPAYNLSNDPNVKEDFGEWDKFDSREDYLNFQRKWLKIALPKLKKGGNVLIFAAFEYGGYLMEILREVGLTVRNHSVWHKSNPPTKHKSSDISSCEFIIWATKGKNATYNWLGSKKAHNFIETPLCQGNGRTSHPTQKPIEVMKWLLEKYTNPGDLVLDPFAGSGSTGVACKLMGRNYVLIEEYRPYYEFIKMRMKSTNE